jgi:hypothetical protein
VSIGFKGRRPAAGIHRSTIAIMTVKPRGAEQKSAPPVTGWGGKGRELLQRGNSEGGSSAALNYPRHLLGPVMPSHCLMPV